MFAQQDNPRKQWANKIVFTNTKYTNIRGYRVFDTQRTCRWIEKIRSSYLRHS